MTTYDTPNGRIFAGGLAGGPCRDDYDNIEIYDQPGLPGHAPVELQRPAMKAFKEAERRWARLTRPWRRGSKIRPIELIPGTTRSCAYQAELYRRDPARYAPPEVGLHPRRLAIDVRSRSRILKRILRRLGWRQARPSDEPWHWSYWLTA